MQIWTPLTISISLLAHMVTMNIGHAEPPDIRIDLPARLNWEFFSSAGIELEKHDFPDMALRCFRTSLLLVIDEKNINATEKENVRKYINDWVQQTKARRLGAFKTVTAMIQIGPEAQPFTWKIGYDLRQVTSDNRLTRICAAERSRGRTLRRPRPPRRPFGTAQHRWPACRGRRILRSSGPRLREESWRQHIRPTRSARARGEGGAAPQVVYRACTSALSPEAADAGSADAAAEDESEACYETAMAQVRRGSDTYRRRASRAAP